MAGADMVFSLQPRVQKMIIDSDLPQIERINEEIPEQIIERLYGIPEFVRAYEEDGLRPEEFVSFGVTQKTLSQFLWTGWVPLEQYGSENRSNRWF